MPCSREIGIEQKRLCEAWLGEPEIAVDLAKRKAAGEEIKAPERPPASNVISLMDALRESVKAGRSGKGQSHTRRSAERRRKAAAHSQRRASGRTRKAS